MRLIDTPFGRAVDLAPEVQGAQAIIVAVNVRGRQPKRLLLPHQLYVHTARALLKDQPIAEPWIDVLPLYNSDRWIRVDLDELERRYAPEAQNEGSAP